MLRFEGSEPAQERRRFPPPPGRSGSWWLVRGVRILVLSTIVAVPMVPALFFLMPMPRGADGITLCFPFLGPLQQFAEDMDPDLEEIVQLHERVHASQCRRLGAIDYALTYVQDRGMLALEAEAFCAEAHMLASRGIDATRWVDRVVETLYLEYPHDSGLSRDDIRRIVAAWCPPSAPSTPHP